MLDELMAMLPPPPPKKVEKATWANTDLLGGLQFPSDFKDFISIYGCGGIDGFLWVLDPFSSNQNLNFEKSFYFMSAYALMREDFVWDYPRPNYPEKGSFLPWAVTDNGETFVWIVDGDPDSWTVAIHSSDQGEEELYGMGCVEFLLKLIKGEISSGILPSQFPPAGLTIHSFTSIG